MDCGAYNGDTLQNFIQFANGSYSKIFAVELDEKNFIELNNLIRIKNYRNVETFNCGVWNKKDTVYFLPSDYDGSAISTNGTTFVEVDTIDNIVKNFPISLIKMDIEGAELNALKGAINTIKNFKPALAICVYHKKDDLITIPQFIKNLNSDYKLYLRRYSWSLVDLVLYAI